MLLKHYGVKTRKCTDCPACMNKPRIPRQNRSYFGLKIGYAIFALSVLLAPFIWPTNAVAGPAGGKWAIVLCKFADLPADPVTQGVTVTRPWLQTFFTEAGKGHGGMFDYWIQASTGEASLSGTTLFPVNTDNSKNGWYQLPAPSQPGGEGDLAWYSQQVDSNGNKIRARYPVWTVCVKYAESQNASFAGYFGILVVTNGLHDDSALDTGPACPAPTSPEPVACVVINYSNLYVSDVAHEMGHGYGLNHGFDTFTTCQYCDPYDVMSWHNGKSFTGSLGVPDPLTGAKAQTGPALSSPELEKLGWMPSERVYNYATGISAEVTLAPLETPSDKGYLMAKVVTGAYYYTIEYRRKRGMDQGLPDSIVLVHQVRTDGLFYLADSSYFNGNTIKVNPELTAGSTYNTEDLNLEVVSTGETAVVRIFSKGTSPSPLPSPGPGSGGKACAMAGGTWTCGEPLHGKVKCSCEF